MAKYTSQQVSFLKSLKGAPASILIALALTGVSLTNQDLQMVTGYSDKPVTKGLALLELHGLAQNNGIHYGWSLPQGVQLPLFPSALLGRESRSASLGSGPKALHNPVDKSEARPAEVRNISERSEYFRTSQSHARDLSSSSSRSSNSKKKEEEERRVPKGRKISDLRAAQPDVYALLLEAGVGKRSRKMREILALELPVEHVRAFVLDQAALGYPTGHLIQKLLDGDPVPPKRCIDCGQKLPCLCNVIKR